MPGSARLPALSSRRRCRCSVALRIPSTTLVDPPNWNEFALSQELVGGYIQITGNPAEVELLYGAQGLSQKTERLVVATGSYNVGRSPSGLPLTGIRARNEVAGFAGVLQGYFWDVNSPTLSFVGTPSSQVAGSVVIPIVALADWPPASPSDGTTVWLDLPAATYSPELGSDVRWLCVYDAVADLWVVSGQPIVDMVDASESNPNAAYSDLATVGPSLTFPLAGEYLVSQGFQQNPGGASGGNLMSYSIGGAAAADINAAQTAYTGSAVGVNEQHTPTMKRAHTIAADATTLVAKYRRTVANNSNLSKRWLQIEPITVANA